MELVTNMLRKISGVAVELPKLQPKANYTHCHAHFLSLFLKDVTKKPKILGDTMGTAREIIVLITYSPKRENLLGKTEVQSRIAGVKKQMEKSDFFFFFWEGEGEGVG